MAEHNYQESTPAAHRAPGRTETVPFDAAQHLTGRDAQAELLADAVQTGEPTYIAAALDTIARARGMSTVAKDAGVTREALYKALSPKGDPRLSTLLGVLKALDLSLAIAPTGNAA